MNMLDQIMNLVKENAQDAVTNNPDVPADKKESVISEAASSIFDGLKGEASGGGLQNILSSFTSGGGNSGAIGGIIDKVKGSFIQKLVGKLGFSSEKAGGIASMLIPLVINKFLHKTSDPNDSSFNVQGILSSLTGGSGGEAGGMMDKVKGLF